MRKSKHDIPALLKNVTHCDDLWMTKEFEYNPFLSSGSKSCIKKQDIFFVWLWIARNIYWRPYRDPHNIKIKIWKVHSKKTFTCSKSEIETLQKAGNYVQTEQ